ncbi:MAG TPA: 2,4'-dihydroxyacetophenone dioxygenase family protein [Pyrinomonadaceae bacterium]
MNNAAPSQSYERPHLATLLSARNVSHDTIPWVPLSEGKSFKPLRFLSGNRGFVELLRLEPGSSIPTHRHTGEIHAFNLEGSRELCTGELIRPGDYVYEPAGNVDSWKVVGDVPAVILVVVMGAVEYLGPDDNVTNVYTADTLMELYRQYCIANHIELVDLVD